MEGENRLCTDGKRDGSGMQDGLEHLLVTPFETAQGYIPEFFVGASIHCPRGMSNPKRASRLPCDFSSGLGLKVWLAILMTIWFVVDVFVARPSRCLRTGRSFWPAARVLDGGGGMYPGTC